MCIYVPGPTGALLWTRSTYIHIYIYIYIISLSLSSWPQDTPTWPLARSNAQARGPERGRATPMVKAHLAESFQWPG